MAHVGWAIPTPITDLKKLRDEITVEANEVERAIRQLDRKTGGEEQIKGLETRLTSAKTDLVRFACGAVLAQSPPHDAPCV